MGIIMNARVVLTLGSWMIAASICACSTAWGQSVTFDELQGLVIQSATFVDMLISREGRKADVKVEHDMTITIGPGDELYVVNNNTAYTPRGVRKGPPLANSFTVGHLRETRSRGGGDGLWTFVDGALIYLRTYKGGASRNTYTFIREAGGLACTANLNFVSEQGVNGIVLNSAVDGLPMVILNARQLSSSCRISKHETQAH
jgi:hypothetical protein